MQAGLAVFLGGGLGALARWGLTLLVKTSSPFAVGVLLANLLGGLLIGVALAWFSQLANQAAINESLRLFLVVGLLGGLTTFSSFSAEVFSLINNGKLGWALLVITSHLFGSLLMTYLGWLGFKFLVN